MSMGISFEEIKGVENKVWYYLWDDPQMTIMELDLEDGIAIIPSLAVVSKDRFYIEEARRKAIENRERFIRKFARPVEVDEVIDTIFK